ncbi:MAG: saccharopine dehydrogenase NADP-binding domain-containing protein [Acidobacteriota bacterium]|nr:saccharopine dehydrogenase NADP-binding domain-containing protein [Acidobacteriota bacterium]
MASRTAGRDRRILVLGAGMVASPLVDYLIAETSFGVTIAAQEFHARVERVAEGSRARLVQHDSAADADGLRRLVSEHDLVLSLLPPSLHSEPARLCVELGRPLVTTSYVNNEIGELDARARRAGVLLLKECGFHPGLNHMLAMRAIDRVHARGDRLVSYRSYAGGLPAPESNDNPWGYKFSWSPRGVLAAALEPSTQLEDGVTTQIPAGQIFAHGHDVRIEPFGSLEAYPNRNAVKYRTLYGIESAKTVLRCTVRYPGHCATWDQMIRLGLLRDDRTVRAKTYAGMMRRLSGADGEGDARFAVARHLGLLPDDDSISRLSWLGLFEDAPLPAGVKTPRDALLARMVERMSFEKGEHDVVVLYDELESEASDGTRRLETVSLVKKGEIGKGSAMSLTVGLPAAVAARLILDGRLTLTGVRIPVDGRIYRPILAELERIGISVVEHAA